jgi:flagellar export protein FliJ
MSKSLKTLIKISKSAVDSLQKQLAELVKRQDFYKNHIEIFKQQIENERNMANENFENPEIALAFVNFANATNDKIDIAQAEVDKLEIEIATKRDELREAFSEQKKFEIVDAANAERRRLEINKFEDNKLDEIGTSMFIRKQENE